MMVAVSALIYENLLLFSPHCWNTTVILHFFSEDMEIDPNILNNYVIDMTNSNF